MHICEAILSEVLSTQIVIYLQENSDSAGSGDEAADEVQQLDGPKIQSFLWKSCKTNQLINLLSLSFDL